MSKCFCGKHLYGDEPPCHYWCKPCEKPATVEEYDFIVESGMCRKCYIEDMHHDEEKCIPIYKIFAHGEVPLNHKNIVYKGKIYEINELGKILLEGAGG